MSLMGEVIKENKDSIIRWLSIALTLLFYWFGVVKNNEKTRVEVLHLQSQITAIDGKMQRLDDIKADKEVLNMLMNSINRIESKLDRLTEKQ